MQDLVRVDRVGDVAVLTMAHPPVNALSNDLRQALTLALQAAIQAPEITAIVLCGNGKGFSAGADIAEFGKGPSRLGDLCSLIENAPKPVIAALHGHVLGGGLELALSAHYRVAMADAVLGLPEVTLGLLPGAGGTQRLPRLIGARDALRLMLTGTPINGAEALALGLIDRVVERDLTDAAVAMAGDGLPLRRSCDMRRGFKDMAGYQTAIAAARATPSPLPAPARIIDCVEAAALLPFAQGLLAEGSAFADLVATPQASGLRYAFFTTRRAALPPPGVAALGPTVVDRIGLWGADDMAADLVFQALSAGLHVVWAAPERADLMQALGRTAARQEQAVVAGVMTEDTRDADWARLTTALDPAALAMADLILSAPGLDPSALTHAGLGSVAGQGGPAAAITVPYAAGDLTELSLRPDAAPEVVAKLTTLARRLDWRLTFGGPGGPIELHLRMALAAAADHLTAQGVDPALIVAAQTGVAAANRLNTEILTTSLAAMAAEGARMVQDGRARRPLDVDAVALQSGLLPRWLGGPMFQADQRGLLVLRQDLRRRASNDPIFTPPSLLDDLITEGQTFASLNT